MVFSGLSKWSHEIVFAKEPRSVAELDVYPVIIDDVETHGEGVGAGKLNIVDIEMV